MFKWKKDKISSKMTDTFIGEGTIVEGTVRSAGSLRLEGQLRGDISCEGDVILGESGFAVSNITANNVVLAGQVNGNVTITGKLTIMSTGKLYGNMTAAALTIEEGGLLQGSSAMDQDEPALTERRSGADRRVSTLPYHGPERRSGFDRRNLAEGEVPAIPKKISYRAIEKPSADEADGTFEVIATTETAKDNIDPLRESGRAFIHSIAGGTKESGENAAAAQLANNRLNEGLSAGERSALSGILLAEAVEIKNETAAQAREEVADAAEEIAVGLEDSMAEVVEHDETVEAVEAVETVETVESVEAVETMGTVDHEETIKPVETVESLSVAEDTVDISVEVVEAIETVSDASDDVYSSSGRSASDAADLLKNW
ncbi:cytoskeletal protein CcmA (bactofilin family) [Paenibacillus taihuensis]|uniref:Cytoskeletal protein CcmA (Bactofilin family) n=1 Tax=Paenibacillus taihuensis TaxID=1156355 RepID=A0A3D9SKP7_9BACL|nr:polymer-forming cytoskeletal protein [Paenibacillus taihuensis]REE90572.1 cytoskeletal protein CcmA (bactofilin family) [Paenibacillus taihuensis]